MNVRHVPEITFAIDRSEKINSRMDELLGRMEKRRSKLAHKNNKQLLADKTHKTASAYVTEPIINP
jgi:hypothetical protein